MSLRLASFTTLLGAALGQMIKSTVGHGIDISIAIPDVDEGPFDILVKISAPKGTGWAAVAWGGEMMQNPLSIAWPNDGEAVVSARWATDHSLPQVYDGATITVLKSSTASDSGWSASFICTGCSEWNGGSLDPNGENDFAWAFSTRSPFTPASTESIFPAHTDKDVFGVNLSKAKLSDKDWSALVEELDRAPVEVDDDEVAANADDAADVDVDDKVKVVVGVPDDEDDRVVVVDDEEPVEEPKVVKPVVKTSVIVLAPPAETDVDAPTAVDREDKIPRPTFMPIPEPGEPADEPDDDTDEDPNRIPRPTFLPDEPADQPDDSKESPDKIPRPTFLPDEPVDQPDDNKESPDKIPRPTFLPDEPVDQPDDKKEDPDKIPRPTFLPQPGGKDDDVVVVAPAPSGSTVRTIPRPTALPPVPDSPIGGPVQDPDRIPVPIPRPSFDSSSPNPPVRTPAPDQPLPVVPRPWDDDDDDDDDWNYNPPAPPVPVMPPVQPVRPAPPVQPVQPVQPVRPAPPPPPAPAQPTWSPPGGRGGGGGGGRGGGGGGRGRGRGRGR